MDISSFLKFKAGPAIWALLLGLGLSFSIVVGDVYEETGFCELEPVNVMFLFVLAIFLTFLFYCLLMWVTRDKEQTTAENAVLWKPCKKDACVALALFIIPQIVVWLIMWPGVYNHDGPFFFLQMTPSSAANDYPLWAHYPLLYTVLLGGMVQVGARLGIPEVTFAFVMALQTVALIYAQFKATMYVGKETHSKIFFWITLIFFALHPFGLILRISSCHDILFCAFLLLTLIEAFEVGKSISKGVQPQKKTLIKLVVFVTLMSLFRTNGVYLYTFALLFTLPLLIRKKLFKTTGVLVVPIVAVLIFTGPVYKLCGVADSGDTIQEMSSIASQQFARAWSVSPETFTDDEKEQLELFYPGMISDKEKGADAKYLDYPEISDDMKRLMDDEYTKAHLGQYVAFYFEIGAKNVGNYVDAYMMHTLGWWFPFKEYPDTRVGHPYMRCGMAITSYPDTYEGYVDIERHSVCPEVADWITDVVSSSTWNKVPVLNIFFDTGMWTWIFFTLCAIAILKKRGDSKFAFLIVFGLFLTLLLSPLCYFRYSYALMICLPLLAIPGFSRRKQRWQP